MNCHLVIAVAALMAIATAPLQRHPVKLRYGVIANSARNISSLPLYTAQRQGFLETGGIALEIVPLPGVEHM